MRTAWAITVGALALALWPASAAAAGPTVTYDGAYVDAGGLAYLQTTGITAHIQDVTADDELQCSVDDGTAGPCGTQDASCPVAQCWTYSFTGLVDGYNHDLTVDAGPKAGGSIRYDNYFRVAPDPPPDPALTIPPGSDLDFREPLASERPEFQFGAASDGPRNAPLRATQCAATPAGSSAVTWLQCNSGAPFPRRLALLQAYDFQVRAVDVFGRVDPDPPKYVFSPTPCRPRLVGPPRSLSQFASGGIRVRVHCVQRVGRGSFVDLATSEAEANRLGLPGAILASWYVRTSHVNQTVVVRLRGLNKLPRYVFGVHGIHADLVAVQRESYGYAGTQRNVVRKYRRPRAVVPHPPGHAIVDQLTAMGEPEELITRPELVDPRANEARANVLAVTRGYGEGRELFEFPTGVRWVSALLDPGELAAVRYIEYSYWNEISGGSRLPADAARRIRAGIEAFGVPNDRFLTAATAVVRGERFPPLILCGVRLGELVCPEGNLRLTGHALAGFPFEVECLVGVAPTMARWAQ